MSAETSAVAEGPAEGAAAARHARTCSPVQAPGFRAVTYNILADQYASTEHAQTHLFGYCPSQCALTLMACHLCRTQHLGVTTVKLHHTHVPICSNCPSCDAGLLYQEDCIMQTWPQTKGIFQ